MAAIQVEDQYLIPDGIDSLSDFRRWVHSEEFPERGRIDYIAGTIEVDMQAQSAYSHGGVAIEIIRVLSALNMDHDLGELYSYQSRIASLPAELSAEPDIVFLSHETLDSGRVKIIEKANRPDDSIEFDGGPDMVAEIVSDSSVAKDTRRLPRAYFAAGVDEYWLIDARGNELLFTIHRRGDSAFEPITIADDGFQKSSVFSREFKFTRERNHRGNWKYKLLMQ